MAQSLEFRVKGDPVSKQRPRGIRFSGRHYTPKKTLDAEKRIRLYALASKDAFGWEKVEKPNCVKVEIVFGIKMPKTMTKAKHGGNRAEMVGRPCPKNKDVDNLEKTCLDALNDCNIWHDDCQVTDLHARKIWDPEGFTEVRITRI